MPNEKRYLFDDPRNVNRVLWLLYAASALALLLDLVVHRHTEHPWESMLGFYPLYGFLGCTVLVILAKWLRKLIMRPEDYYRRRDLPQHPGGARSASSAGENP